MKKILLFFLTPIATILAQNLQISGGNAHSVAICESGDIYAWGKNDVGQLGPTGGGGGPTPILVTGFPAGLDIKQTDAGSGSHTLALGCDTKVYAWGTNGSGQLGNGATATSSPTPTAVKGIGCTGELTGVTYVSGGNDESFAILANKTIVAWGQNDAGQLGDGTTTDRLCPVQVRRCAANGGGILSNVIQVEAGDENCYALLEDGTVWSWGQNVGGNGLALGRGTAGTNTIATNNSCAAPMQYANPANIANFSATTVTNIKSISAGDRHLLLLDNNGYVWSTGGDWGGGSTGTGQIGTGAGYQSPAGVVHVLAPGDPRCTTANNNDNQAAMTNANFFGNVISISGLQASSIAVTADGRAWAWGGDGFFDGCPTGGGSVASGHLGIGGLQTGTTCVADVGRGCPTAVTTTGGVPLTGIASVSDGDAVSFFIGETGTVYTAGSGRYGQVGSSTNQTRAVSLPSLNSLPCNVAMPVAPKPNLGGTLSKCPAAKALLNGQVTQLTPYNFIWEYSATGTAPWTVVEAFDGPGSSIPTGQNADTIYVRNSGYYRLIITDDRAALAANCAPPGTVGDTVQITDLLPPAGTLQAGTCGTDVCFQVDTSTTTGAIDPTLFDWYKDVLGGGKLNASPSANPFCVPMASLNAPVGGVYTIYAEDKRRFRKQLYPTAAPCASSASDNIDKYYNELIVYQDIKDITFQFNYIANGNGGTPPITVQVYANDPTKNSNTGGPVVAASGGFVSTIISPVGLVNSTTAQLVTMSLTGTLTGSPGGTTYWIRLSGGDKSIVYPSTCKNASYTSVLNGVTVLSSTRVSEYGNINNPQPYGSIFNLDYTTGSPYTCGRFPLKANSVAACLPVQYLSFTGEALQNSVKLNWTVSYESGVKYYSIQRSSNGKDFTEVGQRSTLTSAGLKNYSYTDILESTYSGKLYYKIVEVSNSGQSSTNIISVILSSNANRVFIAPNPNSGSFKISLEDETDAIAVEVYDLAGRLVHTQSGSGNIVNVNLGATAKGVYFVYVSNGTDKWVEKVIVE